MPPLTFGSLIVTLIVVGVVLYFIGLIDMDGKILNVIRALILLAVVLWVLKSFGIFRGSFPLR